MNEDYKDRDWLFRKYVKDGYSTVDIAHFCSCNHMKIWRWLKKLGIPTRPFGSWTEKTKSKVRDKIGNQVGDKNRHWKGGITKSPNGYIWVYQPSHPFANDSGYIQQHRLVAEKALGKYIDPKHPIHHVNGTRDDNRNGNLVICEDQAYHRRLHIRAKQRRQNEKGTH